MPITCKEQIAQQREVRFSDVKKGTI